MPDDQTISRCVDDFVRSDAEITAHAVERDMFLHRNTLTEEV